VKEGSGQGIKLPQNRRKLVSNYPENSEKRAENQDSRTEDDK
jgi:hypothetical protein